MSATPDPQNLLDQARAAVERVKAISDYLLKGPDPLRTAHPIAKAHRTGTLALMQAMLHRAELLSNPVFQNPLVSGVRDGLCEDIIRVANDIC